MAQEKSRRSSHFSPGGGGKIPSVYSPKSIGNRKPDGVRGNPPAWRAGVAQASRAVAIEEADRAYTQRDHALWVAIAADWAVVS